MQFKAYAADKGLSLQTYLHLPASAVCLDEDALRKILINLMSNAIKFTPQKGVIKLFAATISEASAHSLFVSVCDSGPGIAETDHSRVFDRFYQSHNQLHLSASGQSGTGIGLYLCRWHRPNFHRAGCNQFAYWRDRQRNTESGQCR